jgi:hypothetical protein
MICQSFESFFKLVRGLLSSDIRDAERRQNLRQMTGTLEGSRGFPLCRPKATFNLDGLLVEIWVVMMVAMMMMRMHNHHYLRLRCIGHCKAEKEN